MAVVHVFYIIQSKQLETMLRMLRMLIYASPRDNVLSVFMFVFFLLGIANDAIYVLKLQGFIFYP